MCLLFFILYIFLSVSLTVVSNACRTMQWKRRCVSLCVFILVLVFFPKVSTPRVHIWSPLYIRFCVQHCNDRCPHEEFWRRNLLCSLHIGSHIFGHCEVPKRFSSNLPTLVSLNNCCGLSATLAASWRSSGDIQLVDFLGFKTDSSPRYPNTHEGSTLNTIILEKWSFFKLITQR